MVMAGQTSSSVQAIKPKTERNSNDHRNENTELNSAAPHLADHGLEGMPEAFRILLDHAMKLERSKVLQAEPHERTALRQGYANGFKPKTVATRLGDICFAVPQVRGEVAFYPSALEKVSAANAPSNWPSPRCMSKASPPAKSPPCWKRFAAWRSLPPKSAAPPPNWIRNWKNGATARWDPLLISSLMPVTKKVRIDGVVRSCAVLIALGLDDAGQRSVLGVSARLSEAHWREFVASLQARGLHGLRFIVSDDHAGLRAALTARFAGVPWQRCQFHLQQNAIAFVPKIHLRAEVAATLRTVFNAADLPEAQRRLKTVVEKYQESVPNLAGWLETNGPESLTVLALPEAQRKKLRTTNSLERLNKEIKRRTRVATLFPNEKSLERLVTALLSEVSDEWEPETFTST